MHYIHLKTHILEKLCKVLFFYMTRFSSLDLLELGQSFTFAFAYTSKGCEGITVLYAALSLFRFCLMSTMHTLRICILNTLGPILKTFVHQIEGLAYCVNKARVRMETV